MDDFKEEFKKLAEEKGMTYPELAKIIIDKLTDEEGCMSFGGYAVDKCALKETLSATDLDPLKRRANAFYGKKGVFKEWK